MSTLENLTLLELLNLANEAYPDGFLAEYYDTATGEPRQGGGDSLARFVAAEITETFDPNAPRGAQLQEVRNVLSQAVEMLSSMIDALS